MVQKPTHGCRALQEDENRQTKDVSGDFPMGARGLGTTGGPKRTFLCNELPVQ